jgi:hypothetical protein
MPAEIHRVSREFDSPPGVGPQSGHYGGGGGSKGYEMRGWSIPRPVYCKFDRSYSKLTLA